MAGVGARSALVRRAVRTPGQPAPPGVAASSSPASDVPAKLGNRMWTRVPPGRRRSCVIRVAFRPVLSPNLRCRGARPSKHRISRSP